MHAGAGCSIKFASLFCTVTFSNGQGYSSTLPEGFGAGIVLILFIFIQHGQGNDVEVYFDVANFLDFAYPTRGDPCERACWVKPKFDSLCQSVSLCRLIATLSGYFSIAHHLLSGAFDGLFRNGHLCDIVSRW